MHPLRPMTAIALFPKKKVYRLLRRLSYALHLIRLQLLTALSATLVHSLSLVVDAMLSLNLVTRPPVRLLNPPSLYVMLFDAMGVL